MAEARFDEIIHAPLRLRICGLLRHVDSVDFALLRDSLEVSDATLSKHVKTLAAAGYVCSRKAASTRRGDARRIMWLSLTQDGRSAFDAHMRTLREIAGPGH
ncbi:transcriptional regulator [Isoptericola sp. b408]|uniref:transcriptional regulator n=1 Tax=Isoptericola sp. b408 TaxID=3064653 RepID=UPI00271249C6|nr:transcriptional regulator [Isoptericola sp. b408]MDO8150090.1 transcriptional regulator [Isoptericola sp. b408]